MTSDSYYFYHWYAAFSGRRIFHSDDYLDGSTD
nr:MAG TPA: hypothetical protein [Inoviridae sp.]